MWYFRDRVWGQLQKLRWLPRYTVGMARRSSAQKIGAMGHKWLAARIEAHPEWLARELGEDYGIDLEAELTSDNQVKGDILKIQIKSQAGVEQRNDKIKFRIERKYIDYAESCRYPVVFVLVDTKAKAGWWIWLQDWLLEKQSVDGTLATTQASWVQWVAMDKTIDRGLNGEWAAIARWKGETQLTLTLLDALRSAAALYDYRLIERLTEILSDRSPSHCDALLAAVIGEAIRLGDRMRGTSEGNEVSPRLFALVRKVGSRVSPMTLRNIVIRGDSYSRAGLSALGILYDDFPGHMHSLGLPSYFLSIEPRVAFYCAFREAFGSDFTDPGEFTFAGLRYARPVSFLEKYANRGPSALLDYLERVDNGPTASLQTRQHEHRRTFPGP